MKPRFCSEVRGKGANLGHSLAPELANSLLAYSILSEIWAPLPYFKCDFLSQTKTGRGVSFVLTTSRPLPCHKSRSHPRVTW